MIPDMDLDALAREFAEETLRTGHFAEHGDSLESMVDLFDGEPWWDESLPTEEIVRSEAFREGFRAWMSKRVRFAFGMLREDVERVAAAEGELEVARAMKVTRDWLDGVSPGDALGVFWAADHDAADIFAHQADQSLPVELFVQGVCGPEDVDWKETLRSRIDYVNGDEECEIRLKEDARVRVASRAKPSEIPEGEYGTGRSLDRVACP